MSADAAMQIWRKCENKRVYQIIIIKDDDTSSRGTTVDCLTTSLHQEPLNKQSEIADPRSL